MTAEQALRFIDYQARQCRDKDSHEALCLLLPALLRALQLQPMTGVEALDVLYQLKKSLHESKPA